MSVETQPFENDSFDGHETITYVNDDASGLHAIIAIHSTTLGPAAGGCRMLPYPDTAAALYDVLRLSKGMSYKCAVANLPLGGGKAVILGDPSKDKTPERLRAFGRAVNRLNGAYWTAEDMNIGTDDVAVIAEKTSFAAGLETGKSASGNPSPFTAKGVFEGIKIAMKHRFGSPNLDGATIAVLGIGNVGFSLCEMLHKENAKIIVADSNDLATARAREQLNADIVSPDEILSVKADVFSPCAGGAILDHENIPSLQTPIIAGAANNQLKTSNCGALLKTNNILYAPDYVINGGGIINVASEILKISDPDWVTGKLKDLMKTLDNIFTRASDEDIPTDEVADMIAKERISNSGENRRIAI